MCCECDVMNGVALRIVLRVDDYGNGVTKYHTFGTTFLRRSPAIELTPSCADPLWLCLPSVDHAFVAHGNGTGRPL